MNLSNHTRRLVIVLSTAAFLASGSSATRAAASTSVPRVHFHGSITPPHAATRASGPAALRNGFTGSITVSPSPASPPNALCGVIVANYPTVTGSHFDPSRTGTILLDGKKVASFSTDSNGSFSSRFTDPSQPSGTYTLTARESPTRTATTQLDSTYASCVDATGDPNTLHWEWQTVGFDAFTRATIFLNGNIFDHERTDRTGAFHAYFTKPCPGPGTFSITLRGIVRGKRTNFRIRNIDCGAAFTQIPQPTSSYTGGTCLLDLTGIADGAVVSQVSGCGETLSFSQAFSNGLTKYSASDGYAWGTPPAVEPGTPDSLEATGEDTLTITFSSPVSVAGLEIQPERICSDVPQDTIASWKDAQGNTLGQVEQLLPGCDPAGGAMLFAAHTLPQTASLTISSTGSSCCAALFSIARIRVTT